MPSVDTAWTEQPRGIGTLTFVDPPSFAPPPPPPPPPAAQIQPIGWVGILGCAAGVIGSFMAWITVTTGLGSVSISGTDGDGKVSAAIGILAGFAALVGLSKGARGQVILAVLLAVAGLALSIYEWRHVSDKIDGLGSNEFARASVGTGIWVMLAGFAVATACLANQIPADPLDAYKGQQTQTPTH